MVHPRTCTVVCVCVPCRDLGVPLYIILPNSATFAQACDQVQVHRTMNREIEEHLASWVLEGTKNLLPLVFDCVILWRGGTPFLAISLPPFPFFPLLSNHQYFPLLKILFIGHGIREAVMGMGSVHWLGDIHEHLLLHKKQQ